MIIEALQTIFERDLKKLKIEIESFQQEENIWHIEKNITNSAGNLCLHLIGNLNAYIGVGLGNSNYVRQRDLEFSLKDIPKVKLIRMIEETMIVVKNGLNNLTAQQLDNDFPVVIWDKPTGMAFTLLHIATHLNYHLGQINYHRRLLDKP